MNDNARFDEVMTVTELLQKVGDENIDFQYLHEALAGVSLNKGGGVRVTFLTDEDRINPTDVMNGGTGEYTGIVLWLPKDRVAEAIGETPQQQEGGG